ncbi:MAG TPA: efflux RND transporter periplasmic adaptor subunit, partial [Ignavibacteriaceae bacterium]|nr:efflux RND transporter periplasmic adaptor subunit [Ignavibacteriaceae bacterium]
MKKIIVISVIVIALVVSAYFLFFNNSHTAYTYRFDKVAKGDLTVYVTATGTLNAVTSVDVGTQVSGIISKLYADFNSVVKAGDIIAQIDPQFLDQAVKNSQANFDRLQAQYNQSERTYERTKALYDKKLESQSNYDAALANAEGDKASLKQAQAQLDLAKLNLQYATIYAPINGVVINRQVSVGQTVAASFSSPTLFTIANDLSKMQVEATVDESDIGSVSVGQTATFTVDAYPNDNFTGKVSQIRLAPQIVSNVVNYTVIISVENDQLKLMPGMTANVKILVGEKNNVLEVSNLALRFQPPPELIDSTMLKEMREMFRSRGKGQAGNEHIEGNQSENKEAKGGQIAENKNTKSTNTQTKNKQTQAALNNNGSKRGMNGNFDLSKFEALRDSIMKAHGGKMSRDEMMSEFKKAFDKLKSSQKNQNMNPTMQQSPVTGANQYTI